MKNKSWQLQMAIGSGGRNKGLIDLVPSPVRTGLMFGDAGMVTPCLLALQLWVLGQGVGNEDLSCPGPCPRALGCLRLAWPFCPHSACALGWPIVLDAQLRLQVGLQPRFLWWELQGDFMERMSLDCYQITLLLTVGRLEFQTQEVQRQFTDTHCWPES